MIDPVEFGKAMGAIVREATAPLIARIEQLEKALDERPSLDDLAKAVAELLPAPKDGEPGKDGVSVTIEDVHPVLEQLVADAVKAIPPAEKGQDADMDALRVHLGELVKSIQLPAAPTVDEVAAAFERRFSDLALHWERQVREDTSKALDRIPAPKDGRDALPVEAFELSLGEDQRTVTVALQAGDKVVSKSLKLPTILDRGVYSAEKSYEQGDATSYGGCLWIAQKDAPEGVPGASADWRLSAKKGRDGKDLRDNASRHDPSKGVSIK
ncbi:hypothetical protein D3C76_214000 [compost metagenome]